MSATFKIMPKSSPLAAVTKLTEKEVDDGCDITTIIKKAKKMGYKLVEAAGPSHDLFVWMRRQSGEWLLLEDPSFGEIIYGFKKL